LEQVKKAVRDGLYHALNNYIGTEKDQINYVQKQVSSWRNKRYSQSFMTAKKICFRQDHIEMMKHSM